VLSIDPYREVTIGRYRELIRVNPGGQLPAWRSAHRLVACGVRVAGSRKQPEQPQHLAEPVLVRPLLAGRLPAGRGITVKGPHRAPRPTAEALAINVDLRLPAGGDHVPAGGRFEKALTDRVPEFQASDTVPDSPYDMPSQSAESIPDQQTLPSFLATAPWPVPVDTELYPGTGRCQRSAGTLGDLARRRVIRGLSGTEVAGGDTIRFAAGCHACADGFLTGVVPGHVTSSGGAHAPARIRAGKSREPRESVTLVLVTRPSVGGARSERAGAAATAAHHTRTARPCSKQSRSPGEKVQPKTRFRSADDRTHVPLYAHALKVAAAVHFQSTAESRARARISAWVPSRPPPWARSAR